MNTSSPPDRPCSTGARAPRPARRRARLALAFLVLLAGCRGIGSFRPKGVPEEVPLEQVPESIEQVRQDLATGETRLAFWRALALRDTPGLPGDLRSEAQVLLDRSTLARVEAVSATGGDPDELIEMLDLELPQRLAVRAGLMGARLLYEKEGERMDAFRLVKRVDRLYPGHYERALAGALVGDIGFDLARDGGRYMLFFKHRENAPQVLEYLVLNYPSEPRGDQAYWVLGAMYEADRYWDLAIEKHEELVLWHPESPYAVASRARIPHLRLAALDSPEYGRGEVERARGELAAWLEAHGGDPDDELEQEVRRDQRDALGRLADNDLVVARFYRTVKNPVGAEYHARRALAEAREAFDPEQEEEARQLLDDLSDSRQETAP